MTWLEKLRRGYTTYILFTVVVVVVGRSIILLLQIVGEGDIF